MLALAIRNYLEEALGLTVYLEYPADPPDSFVVVRRSGNGQQRKLNEANLIAESYGPSNLAAGQLNDRVKLALDDLDSLDEISSAALAADYPAYDNANKRYRYQAVYNIYHY